MKGYPKSVICVVVALAIFALSPFISVYHVAADSSSATASIGVKIGCVGTISGGLSSTYVDVTPNTIVTLTVLNTNSSVSQTISGSVISDTLVDSSAPAQVSFPISESPITIKFTPVPNSDAGQTQCVTGSTASAASLIINPANATLACDLQDSKWVLSGKFTGSSTGSGVFNGSTQVASITGSGAFTQQVAAGTSGQTFTVIDGTTYGGKGTILASAACPRYTTTAAPTTPATSTKADTVPMTDTTPSNKKASDSVGQVTMKEIKKTPTEKILAASPTAKIAVGVGIGIGGLVIILVVLGLLNIWNGPGDLLMHLWRKLRPTKQYQTRRYN